MESNELKDLVSIKSIGDLISHFKSQNYLTTEDSDLLLGLLKERIGQKIKKIKEKTERADEGIEIRLEVLSNEENEGLEAFFPNGNKISRCLHCPPKYLREIHLLIKGVNFGERVFCLDHARVFFVSELQRKGRLVDRKVLEQIEKKILAKKPKK